MTVHARALLRGAPLLLAAAVFLASGPAAAANRLYMTINGVTSPAPSSRGVANEFDLRSFSWEGAQPLTVGPGNTMLSGRAVFLDVTVVRKVDRASPTLTLKAASGDNILNIVIIAGESGAGGVFVERYRLTLENCLISALAQRSLVEGEAAYETLTINYRKITYTATGATTTTSNWNQATNTGTVTP